LSYVPILLYLSAIAFIAICIFSASSAPPTLTLHVPCPNPPLWFILILDVFLI